MRFILEARKYQTEFPRYPRGTQSTSSLFSIMLFEPAREIICIARVAIRAPIYWFQHINSMIVWGGGITGRSTFSFLSHRRFLETPNFQIDSGSWT